MVVDALKSSFITFIFIKLKKRFVNKLLILNE